MKNNFRKILCAVFALSLLCNFQISAQQAVGKYTPNAANLRARKEFQDNKFGIFLHWGIYSMLAQGEWYMNNRNINYKEYAKIAAGFYPSKFNAAEWVSTLKKAGAKYICITSRHHDSFSMFKTKESSFNIVDATPFKRDIIKELADECHKQGMKFHIYYSHLDWSREDYPLGRTGRGTGRPKDKQNWDSYYKFMNNQLTELLTNYGTVNAIWFDGMWDRPNENWDLENQYALIHSLQPACLVGNNHHKKPFDGEDFQMFERDLPGENKHGYSEGSEIGRLPLETCTTMNGMWGYKIEDQKYKSSKEIIHMLVKAAGKDANLLMNIGPEANGELPAEAVSRLMEVGNWLKVYGETIYGTRQGDITSHAWGVSTKKDNRLFIHVLDLQDKSLFLPLDKKVVSAVCFKDKTPVKFRQEKNGLIINFDKVPEDIDYVVELKLKK